MPRKRDISLTFALCLSLTAHAWIIYTVAERYVAQYAMVKLAPAALPANLIAIDNKPPPPPEPPMRLERLSQLGDQISDGQALASSEGEKPQQAPLADQEQASLSLDPEGENGRKEQSAPPAPPPSPPAFASVAPSAAPQFALPGTSSDLPLIDERFDGPRPRPKREEKKEQESDSPNEQQPDQQFAQATPQQKPSPPRPEQPPSPQSANQSNARAPGDPAPLAESESDSFSTVGDVDFSRGNTKARFGRKHKLFRPRLEMAGQADMMQIQAPIVVVLRIYTNVAGNVEKVDIVKSSGSINIDQPTRLAAYRWWFEPPVDSSGKPKTDMFEFVCRFI